MLKISAIAVLLVSACSLQRNFAGSHTSDTFLSLSLTDPTAERSFAAVSSDSDENTLRSTIGLSQKRTNAQRCRRHQWTRLIQRAKVDRNPTTNATCSHMGHSFCHDQRAIQPNGTFERQKCCFMWCVLSVS